MGISLEDLVAYLDRYLRIAEVPDEAAALNGLQVESSGGKVERVLAAVDACQATIDAAAQSDADLLLVHHGLFWAGNQPVTGRHWRRIRRLIQSDIALYSAHIPLDVHPEVGNNAVLANAIGLSEERPFGDYRGVPLGVAGELNVSRAELVDRLGDALGSPPHLIPGGPDPVKHVGVITGGAGSMIGDAREAGLDTFITGEGAHYTHFDAEEGGINVLYGGHYATETFGVKALAAHVESKFDIPWSFADHPTGL